MNGNVGIGNTNPVARLSFPEVHLTDLPIGMTWYSGEPLQYGIYRTAGTWTGPDYQQMRVEWKMGIILDPGTCCGKSYVDIKGNGLRVTSGNVGIGTTTPTEKLHVTGNIRVTGNGTFIAPVVTGSLVRLGHDDVNKYLV